MAQFTVADIPGQFQQGQQFATTNQAAQQTLARNQFLGEQEQKLAPLQFQAAQLGVQQKQQNIETQHTEESLKRNIQTALELKSVPPERREAILVRKLEEGLNAGRDMTQTEQALEFVRAGRFEELAQGGDQLIKVGERFNLIKPVSTKPQEIAIRQQESNLRKGEMNERKLDRELKRETNKVKKEELEIKLDETKRKNTQAKKDREFNANNAVTTTSNTIDTIKRMLVGGALEEAAGFEANFPTVSGSPASGFEAMIDTLQSQAFLGEIEKMKGLGALSESEGKKLAQSIGSLTINQPDKILRSELVRIKDAMTVAQDKLKAKFSISTGPLSTSEADELAQLRAEFGGQ